MKEEYRLFRTWHVTQAGDHVINYYISNLGNVKMWTEVTGDVVLTIGHGLYVKHIKNSDYEIRICGLSNLIYQTVWDMFGDKRRGIIDGTVWQIHHVDNNHNNNAIENLICITDKEHLLIHAMTANNKERNDKLQQERYALYHAASLKYKEHLKEWKDYLNSIRKQLQKIYAEERQIQTEHNKATRSIKQQQKEQQIKALLESGEYQISKTGRLAKKWSAERREKTIKSMRSSSAYRNRQCCVNKGCIGITYNNQYMYINASEKDEYLAKGAQLGFINTNRKRNH